MTLEISDADGNFPDTAKPAKAPKPAKHGGARAGAGRKAPGYVKPQETKDFEVAKARKETALADLHELDYKVKSGQYVSRVSVKQVAATIMATLAQGIRSLPDHLERRGVEASVCVQIDAAITEALADTGKSLKKLWQTETQALADDFEDPDGLFS